MPWKENNVSPPQSFEEYKDILNSKLHQAIIRESLEISPQSLEKHIDTLMDSLSERRSSSEKKDQRRIILEGEPGMTREDFARKIWNGEDFARKVLQRSCSPYLFDPGTNTAHIMRPDLGLYNIGEVLEK